MRKRRGKIKGRGIKRGGHKVGERKLMKVFQFHFRRSKGQEKGKARRRRDREARGRNTRFEEKR